MPWVKLDESFPEHPKVLAAGGDAAWLHVCAIAYCNRNLTDGRVPAHVLTRLSDRKRPEQLVRKLVDAGLWEPAGDGWAIHDFLDYQTPRAKVEAERAQARDRMRRARAGPSTGSADVPPNSPPGSEGVRANNHRSYANPIRSDPIRSQSSSSSPSSTAPDPCPDDDDDERIDHAIAIHARFVSQRAHDPRSYARAVVDDDRETCLADLRRHIEVQPDITAQELAVRVFQMSVVNAQTYDPRRQ